jgi:acyl-CoA synthetase (AMP-forming)/AMP-acid ligase II
MLSIDEMLRRSARDRPGKEGLAFRGRRISFSELDRSSTHLAHFLKCNGVEPGMRVAVFSSKCLEEVIAIFAIAKAGGVLVHLNPAFRDDKLRHVLHECEPATVFVHASKRAAIQRAAPLPFLLVEMGLQSGQVSAPPARSLDEILDDRGLGSSADALGPRDEQDLAAIIYTSGTTASAKGIKVTHRILSDCTLVSAQVLDNVPSDRLISVTPFSFDGALSQLFTAVFVGGTLVLQDSTFPKDVIHTLLSEKVTGFHAVPSFWRMMLARYPGFAECEFPYLRYVSLIGEAFPEEDLARLRRILRHTDFYIMYGTTEAFRSTCLPPADFERKKGSAGLPLPGVEIAIVDENGGRCRPGEVGEIVHRGAFVSPGYWKRDGGTTFRDGGVYTGDLGMLDDDGYLYFVRRKDSMIKRVGYQVYPEEIEACLERLEGVSMSAVVCGPDGVNGPLIRAFVVPAANSKLTVDAVIAHCKRHLPHYMMPDSIEFRPAMPLTGTCKIDRTELAMAGGA